MAGKHIMYAVGAGPGVFVQLQVGALNGMEVTPLFNTEEEAAQALPLFQVHQAMRLSVLPLLVQHPMEEEPTVGSSAPSIH